MKPSSKKSFVLPVLAAALTSGLTGHLSAQTFTTLYSFTGLSDGYSPGRLALSGNRFYGTAGSDSGFGLAFSLSTNGTGFVILHSFSPVSGSFPTNEDGAFPVGPMVRSGNIMYGMTAQGGSFGYGTVFKVITDGTGFYTLHSFVDGGADGGPTIGPLLSGETLYGVNLFGGGRLDGTVFSVKTDGSGFTNIFNFGENHNYGFQGVGPSGPMLTGDTLYGVTTGDVGGGGGDHGTVFKINIDGTGFTNLHSFTGSDGTGPMGSLVLSGNTLYGTALSGGSSGNGTVFTVKTDGSGFTVIHSFTATSTNSSGLYTNYDGAYPYAGLIVAGSTLYGTASAGGTGGSGTVFALNTDGAGFTIIHSFTASFNPYVTNSDGAGPVAGLILSGNTLYGTTSGGGIFGNGTIFSFSLRPELTITRAAPNVILSWATNFTGFTLQSTTNLSSSVWTTNLPSPVVVNGQNTVTNPILATQRFFRLSQ
jgi:uncharacterized repeat protein (TIGR03803 family)